MDGESGGGPNVTSGSAIIIGGADTAGTVAAIERRGADAGLSTTTIGGCTSGCSKPEPTGELGSEAASVGSAGAEVVSNCRGEPNAGDESSCRGESSCGETTTDAPGNSGAGDKVDTIGTAGSKGWTDTGGPNAGAPASAGAGAPCEQSGDPRGNAGNSHGLAAFPKAAK